MAPPASRFRSAVRVYPSACFKVDQPKMAMSSCDVAPFSAARVAPALRKPVGGAWRRPASLQRSRNQLPNPAALKGLPYSGHEKSQISRLCGVYHPLKVREHRHLDGGGLPNSGSCAR